MKRRIICFLLSSFTALSVLAQDLHPLFGDVRESWEKYCRFTDADMAVFNRNHFKDSVSVEEMKAAFYKFKDAPASRQSVFEGYDSLSFYFTLGEGIVLKSPLRDYPKIKLGDARCVWNGRFNPVQLLNKEGQPQEKLLEKVKRIDEKAWKNGEFVTLHSPRRYMGFIVSPTPSLKVYREGQLIARAGASYSYADFFSLAQRTTHVLDGKWHHNVGGGARLMGFLLGINSASNLIDSEKTFSVLLYEKDSPKEKRTSKRARKSYSLELLSPTEPDEKTQQLFNEMKSFIETLPKGTFKPYYTTDGRIMMGRYYRVTVNKCGWLIEDYLILSLIVS